MPDRKIELLRAFLAQGRGRLSLGVREKELAGLTDAEAQRLEELYAEAFEAGPEKLRFEPLSDGHAVAVSRAIGPPRGALSRRDSLSHLLQAFAREEVPRRLTARG